MYNLSNKLHKFEKILINKYPPMEPEETVESSLLLSHDNAKVRVVLCNNKLNIKE